MDAMPMVVACAERQRATHWDDFCPDSGFRVREVRCVCGSILHTTHTQCATCALHGEVRMMPAVWQ